MCTHQSKSQTDGLAQGPKAKCLLTDYYDSALLAIFSTTWNCYVVKMQIVVISRMSNVTMALIYLWYFVHSAIQYLMSSFIYFYCLEPWSVNRLFESYNISRDHGIKARLLIRHSLTVSSFCDCRVKATFLMNTILNDRVFFFSVVSRGITKSNRTG